MIAVTCSFNNSSGIFPKKNRYQLFNSVHFFSKKVRYYLSTTIPNLHKLIVTGDRQFIMARNGSRKKRKKSATCKGCNIYVYKNTASLASHLITSQTCITSGNYWICNCCQKYATDVEENFKRHLAHSSYECANFFEQQENRQRVPIPQPPVLHESNDDSNYHIRFDNDVDEIRIDPNDSDIQLTHVYKNVHDNNLQYVQFIRDDNTNQLGVPNNKIVYSDNMELSSDLQTALLRHAGNISSRANGTFGSVLGTLPGMSNASYVLHDDTLRDLHTHNDTNDGRSDLDESSLDGERLENRDEELHNDSQQSLRSMQNDFIRIVDIDTITVETQEGFEENEEDQQQIDSINLSSDEDEIEICPSFQTKKAREMFKQNIKNVLEGKQVKFPVNRGDPDEPRSKSEDARSTLNALKHTREHMSFTPHDDCLLDLYQMLQKSNAPRGLFDKIIDWTQKNKEIIYHGKLKKRKAAMRSWIAKFGNDIFTPIPTSTKTTLTSGIETNISHFSLRNIILNIVADKELFRKENILIDPTDLRKIPPEDVPYGEPNTGSWYKNAIEHCCPTPKHMLFPLSAFIDGLKLDKFGKLSAEGVLLCYQGFIRKIRLQEDSWHLLGFVEDQSNFKDTAGYVRERKMQDYHDMLKVIFSELKTITDNGGLRVDIDFQDGSGIRKDIIIVPVLQYIIGDCKGNDVLCGRKGTHSLDTPWLCRDCNIPSLQADSVTFRCEPTGMDVIRGKSVEELSGMSHYQIDNAFWELPFGGCPLNIHGNSVAEFLHNFQKGKCEELGKDLSFTDKANKCISENFVRQYPFAKCQSERDIPNLRPFRKGISSVKCLKATETFDRIFAQWLSLMNPSLQCHLKSFKLCGQLDVSVKNTTETIQGHIRVLEETMMLHEWLRLEEMDREDVDPIVEGEPMSSRAHRFLVNYSQRYKDHIVLEKNKCKTTKFHQLLHTVRNIRRVGAFKNVDGSIGEKIAKWLVKDLSRTTNKDRDILSLSICLRYCEKKTVENLLRIRDRSREKYRNAMSSSNSNNRQANVQTGIELCGTTNKKFSLIRKEITIIDNNPENVTQFSIETKWKKGVIPPITGFPDTLVLGVMNRLFDWNPSLGGKLTADSIVEGFTDLSVIINRKNVIFRANPHFRRQGEWFDWAFFDWGEEGLVPGRILMFLDLANCTIINGVEENDDVVNEDDNNVMVENPDEAHRLTNSKFVVIQSAKSSRANRDEINSVLTEYHYDSMIAHWVELEEKYRLVPVEAIHSAAFVVDSIPFLDTDEKDNTALVVSPRSDWARIPVE